MMILFMDRLETALGTVAMLTDGTHLRALDFVDDPSRFEDRARRRFVDAAIREADDPLGVRTRLAAYFAGDPAAVEAIPVDPGGTPFQARVWKALRDIPAGTAVSYGTIAVRVGAPTASRAVGMANSLNPIAIVIPCHRVIGANRALVGYAGGLERKRRLLELEGVRLPERKSGRSTLPRDPEPETALSCLAQGSCILR
jgi:methylated-DNA-[protein]-cysteine S-methyltransferase